MPSNTNFKQSESMNDLSVSSIESVEINNANKGQLVNQYSPAISRSSLLINHQQTEPVPTSNNNVSVFDDNSF